MMQSAIRAQEVNPAKLSQLYRKELELSQVKKGETICVVSDLATRREYIQAVFAAADDLGAGNAGLRLLSEIRFDILKVDLSLVQRSSPGAPSTNGREATPSVRVDNCRSATPMASSK